MPRVSPACCVKFGTTMAVAALMATLLLRAPESAVESPRHRARTGMNKQHHGMNSNHKNNNREQSLDILEDELPIVDKQQGNGIPGGVDLNERDEGEDENKNQHHQRPKDSRIKQALEKQKRPSPPTARVDDYRYDANIPNEPLGVLAQPSSDKNEWIRSDESIRKQHLQNLSPEQEKEKKHGYENCQFNQFVSDQLSLHRHARDTRHPKCVAKRYYPAHLMPAVSVVIVFYNEARSTLLRTAWSVIDRTPPHLLKEIILVDDGSTKEHLKLPLDLEVASMPKTRVLHVGERGGLIRAKVHGVENSTAEVIVFIDSHCEANDGWLEPMLDRIVRNRKIIAMPVIDVIDMNTFEVKQAIIEKGVFSWTQYFYWLAPSGHIMENQPSRDLNTDPLVCPVMAGGIFAIDRDYFWESGAYDMGQETWGGENMEMSFRLWMCGARLEVQPCSRIAHVFRSKSPYTFKDRNPGLTIAHNLNRVAEVWMDEYADVYYNLTGNKHVGFGDVSKRKEFRSTHQCKSFKWYLDNIAPYMFIPTPDHYYKYGKLRNEAANLCLNHEPRDKVAIVTDCTQNWGHAVEWYLTKNPFNGELRHEGAYGSRCVYINNQKRVALDICFTQENGADNAYFHLDAQQRLSSKRYPTMCLDVDMSSQTVTLNGCSDARTQQWAFDDAW